MLLHTNCCHAEYFEYYNQSPLLLEIYAEIMFDIYMVINERVGIESYSSIQQ